MEKKNVSINLVGFAFKITLCLLLLFCRKAGLAQENLLKSEYSYRRYTTQDGMPSNKNNCILQDGKGFIWIAGAKGFTCYDGFTFTNFMIGRDANLYRLDRDENGNIRAKPCFDVAGRLWFGGSKGITIYNYEIGNIVKTMFNDTVKLARYMNNDAEGNVWFSSENRLFVSTGDTVLLKKTLQQLITGIYFTRQSNRLIVSALNGFYLFDKDRHNYVFYNHENGYTGTESSSGAIAEDADGNIWLPSLNGLFRFHPEKLMSAPQKPNCNLFPFCLRPIISIGNKLKIWQ